jgi:tetratricopeptide (TPR) repeat protein
METLNDELHRRITLLCQTGDELMNGNDSIGALHLYHEAWALLPEPKERWDAATWILSAIGDAHFDLKDFKNAIAALSNALRCPNGLGNPFLHLRLGESHFELGERTKAEDELTRAYMGGGREIFESEEPRYLFFLETVLKPPA